MTEESRHRGVTRRVLRALVIIELAAVAALAGGAAWLLYTTSGFAWALARIERAAGSALVLDGAGGTLSGGMTLSRARLSLEDGTTVEARDVALRVSPASLFALAPRVSELDCALLSVTLAASGKPSTPPVSLALPLRLHVSRAKVARVQVNAGGNRFEIAGLEFGYSGDASGHRLQEAAFEIYDTRVTGGGTVGAAKPFPIDVSLAADRKAAPALKATAQIKGPLASLHLAAQVNSAGGKANVEGTLSPYAPLPVEELRATVNGIDLRAFERSLPQTDLGGALVLEPAPGSRSMLSGELKLQNGLAGTYDKDRLPLASLQATLTTDLARVEAKGRADMGKAGSLTGSTVAAAGGTVLELHARGLNLAGLHGRLRATQLSGRIDAKIDGARQAVTADLAERGVQLALRGERSGDTVELSEVRARARGGEMRGTARAALSGAQPFSAEARLSAFDPAAWGDFPQGAVNGRMTAKGSLAPHPALEAQFALDPSQLRGAPLAGNARATVRAERIVSGQADINWGGNRLQAHGAWGGPGDVMTVSVDAPRLGVARSNLAGRINGTAQITGSWKATGVKFDATGGGLAFGGARLDKLAARGEYPARPDDPLRLAATIGGLAVPGLQLQRGSLDIDGTLKAHAATLRAQGKDIDLSARARGGWQAAGAWSGTVETLENRGQYPVLLDAPVAIETGSRRFRMGKLAARIAGGRLDVGELRYEDGRITSQGRFSELRAAVALALAGLSPHAGGTVTLSGAWALASTPRWNGTFSLRLDAGDLSLAADNSMPLGLENLALDGRIVDDRVDFRGALGARAATGRLEGSVQPVTTPDGARITPDSPLKFTSSLEIARIAAFAAETALTFDGRLRAAVAGGGTLRDPLLSGTVEGDDLSIAYVPEGVDLRNGTLRAELANREIRVQSFSIRGGEGVFKARGTLGRGESGRAAMEWEAERLTVMGRPGRRLSVTGRGKAALEDAKVSLSGELRADEGEIRLRTGALLAPGDDVVIAGRQRIASEGPRLRQAALDLALDFGERFRISGRGLDTLLAGKISVRTAPAGNLVAKGAVRAVRGTYTAFGQQLDLERGRLVFEGPLDNPVLDIRAMRKMPAVQAGVEVAGTLQKPFVRVVSEPSMSENEALSWLILGHAPNDASGADLTMLPVAAAALLGQGEDVGTGGVARRFGLDSIGLRSSSTGSSAGTTGSQFVTFGKRIADNVYVVYEQALGATGNVLKLELNLTRQWLLRAETGQVSGLGLFYRWAFD